MRPSSLSYEFVEYVPDTLEEGKIYISVAFATAAHKCCCGCGHEVITPLSPTDWKLTYDGVSVSLRPSIGNWSFPCQSHYWITRNKVEWVPKWSSEEVTAGRLSDQRTKEEYFEQTPSSQVECPPEAMAIPEESKRKSWWERFKEWLGMK